MRGQVSLLQQTQSRHTVKVPAPSPPAVSSSSTPPHQFPKLSLREKWNGIDGKCNVFVTNLSLVFEFQPDRYPLDQSRIMLLSSLLSRQAAEWATSVLRTNNQTCFSYEVFVLQLGCFPMPQQQGGGYHLPLLFKTGRPLGEAVHCRVSNSCIPS